MVLHLIGPAVAVIVLVLAHQLVQALDVLDPIRAQNLVHALVLAVLQVDTPVHRVVPASHVPVLDRVHHTVIVPAQLAVIILMLLKDRVPPKVIIQMPLKGQDQR